MIKMYILNIMKSKKKITKKKIRKMIHIRKLGISSFMNRSRTPLIFDGKFVRKFSMFSGY